MEEQVRSLNPEERAEVRNRYKDVYFPDPVLEPVWYGRREHTRIMDKKTIVDQNKGTVFGICSDQYKIIHYEDIVFMVEKVVEQIKDFGKIQVKPHTFIDGARLDLGLCFPEKKFSIAPGENIIPKMNIFSSLDLQVKLLGRFGMFMLKCSNGAGTWKTFKQFAKKHLLNLFLEELGICIQEGMVLYNVQIDNWKKWLNAKISPEIYEEIWATLPFSPNERTKIEALPEVGSRLLLADAVKQKDLNLWQFNSVLTQFATHEVKSEVRRYELEPIIARSMETAYERIR